MTVLGWRLDLMIFNVFFNWNSSMKSLKKQDKKFIQKYIQTDPIYKENTTQGSDFCLASATDSLWCFLQLSYCASMGSLMKKKHFLSQSCPESY